MMCGSRYVVYSRWLLPTLPHLWAAVSQAHEALQRGDDHSGCTATTLLLSPTHLFVANCGMLALLVALSDVSTAV